MLSEIKNLDRSLSEAMKIAMGKMPTKKLEHGEWRIVLFDGYDWLSENGGDPAIGTPRHVAGCIAVDPKLMEKFKPKPYTDIFKSELTPKQLEEVDSWKKDRGVKVRNTSIVKNAVAKTLGLDKTQIEKTKYGIWIKYYGDVIDFAMSDNRGDICLVPKR